MDNKLDVLQSSSAKCPRRKKDFVRTCVVVACKKNARAVTTEMNELQPRLSDIAEWGLGLCLDELARMTLVLIDSVRALLEKLGRRLETNSPSCSVYEEPLTLRTAKNMGPRDIPSRGWTSRAWSVKRKQTALSIRPLLPCLKTRVAAASARWRGLPLSPPPL